ncbi:MAG: hypothetical protein ABL984_11950 [Pyrinomonadaceae bacterium]|nr:hypothetical protein [Acidobacteriota bacterium]
MENNQEFKPHVAGRYEQWLLGRADAKTREAFDAFTMALQSGEIPLPSTAPSNPARSGGVNYAPNSDFRYSDMAYTVPGTLPGTAGDTNHECFGFFRQQELVDLTLDAAHALKGSGHSLYAANEGADAKIPIWDRTNGQLVWGAAAAPGYDIALQLRNNHIKPGELWYIHFILGAMTADLVPSDLEMYCGIWHKTASEEGWIEGSNFVLDHEIVGIKGTKELNYMVVAVNDSGNTLYSQILNVTDAPDGFDTANDLPGNSISYPRVTYNSAQSGGFIQFKIYREDVAAGNFWQVADIRGTNNFVFDDFGARVNMTPQPALPTPAVENEQALAYSRGLDVGAQGSSLIVNQFTLRIPANYNLSDTLPFSQWLRFGFTRTTAVNRQIRLDKIYLGPTYNLWSDSTFDPTDAQSSTSETSGTPIGGGGIPQDPPPPGGGGCLRFDTPVWRVDLDGEVERTPQGMIRWGDGLVSDLRGKNVVRQPIPGSARFLYRLEFENGVWFFCSKTHQMPAGANGEGRRVALLSKVGDTVWGRTNGVDGPVKLVKKTSHVFKEEQAIGTFNLTGPMKIENRRYLAGHSIDDDSAIWHYNRKPDSGWEF